MITIIRCPLLITADEQLVTMPTGAKILSAQVQHGVFSLWVLCEEQTDETSRLIYVRGTGQDATGMEDHPFIGTVQLLGAALHLFDGGEWSQKQ